MDTSLRKGWLLVAHAYLVAMAVPLAVGCDQAELKGAEAEVKVAQVDLDLPPVPEFKLPEANADGTHPVREMRLRGTRYVDTEITVRGHVTWIYDCAMELRTPEMSEQELKRILTDEPERCNPPNIYLGESADTPASKSIWVVDVPRPPRQDELRAFDAETLRTMKDAWSAMPTTAVGDEVLATGTWAQSSPSGFRNEDGLLVFKRLQNVSRSETIKP